MTQELDTPAELDPQYMRTDQGSGLVTNHNGMADALLRNNDNYRAYRGDWRHGDWNGSGLIHTTMGREDGRLYRRRHQINTDAIAQGVANYRASAERGDPDPLAPLGPDGKLTYRWMDLPVIVAEEISDQWFGGIPWSVIKLDRTMKAQFYQIVEQHYPQYITYPGGRLPLPIRPALPSRRGHERRHFFQGSSS